MAKHGDNPDISGFFHFLGLKPNLEPNSGSSETWPVVISKWHKLTMSLCYMLPFWCVLVNWSEVKFVHVAIHFGVSVQALFFYNDRVVLPLSQGRGRSGPTDSTTSQGDPKLDGCRCQARKMLQWYPKTVGKQLNLLGRQALYCGP